MIRAVYFLLCWMIYVHAQPIKKTTPVVILGGGIAGMTAALQTCQAGLQPLVVRGPTPGGIITVTTEVENWPAEFLISGTELADRLESQIEKRGAELISGIVTQVDFSRYPFIIHVQNPLMHDESYEIEAKSCIIAMGATPNTLKVPGEAELLYRKIFTCAPCDGFHFKNQAVAVIGGGESALVEAHYLSNIAKTVFVLVRRDQFRTIQPALKEKLLSKPNVTVLYHTTVQSFKDDPQGIKLEIQQGTSKQTLLVQGAFLAIGSSPNTHLLKNSLEVDSDGYIILKEGQATSTAGVFAAGDVSDRTFKQAITAAGDGTKAALQTIQFLSSHQPSPAASNTSPTDVADVLDLHALQSIIHSSEKPLIAYFYSPSCKPCRYFRPLFRKWAQEYSSVATFVKINAERCRACFEKYHVQGIPAVLIFDSQGQIIERAVGDTNMAPIFYFLEERKNKSVSGSSQALPQKSEDQ